MHEINTSFDLFIVFFRLNFRVHSEGFWIQSLQNSLIAAMILVFYSKRIVRRSVANFFPSGITFHVRLDG